MRITTRRFVGWWTWVNPAASKTLRLPTWHLLPHHVHPRRRDRQVRLKCPGAALPREVDGASRQRVADAMAPVAWPDREAGHRPDGLVRLVLVPALPGDLYAVGPRTRCVPRRRTSRRAHRRGMPRARWSCPTRGARSRSADGAGTRVPQPGSSRDASLGAACTAGTGGSLRRPACRRPAGGPPSSPRWRARW